MPLNALPTISTASEALLRGRLPPGDRLSAQSGSRLGPKGGASVEFHEHRPYQAGDEIRRVDWKATARAGHPLVKVTREERSRRALVAVDLSPSMLWPLPGAPTPRLQTALCYADLVGHHHHLHGDGVGLASWGRPDVTTLLPGTGEGHHGRIRQTLNEWWQWVVSPPREEASGGMAPLPLWNMAASTIHLVSDFEMPLNLLETGLRSMRALRHHVILIFVLDPGYLHLEIKSADGLFLEDRESPRRLAAPRDLASQVATQVEAHRQDLMGLCHGLGAGFHTLDTRQDLLSQYLGFW